MKTFPLLEGIIVPLWSNGMTWDSESLSPGSIPGRGIFFASSPVYSLHAWSRKRKY